MVNPATALYRPHRSALKDYDTVDIFSDDSVVNSPKYLRRQFGPVHGTLLWLGLLIFRATRRTQTYQ